VERQSIADTEQRPPPQILQLSSAGEKALEASRKRYPLLAKAGCSGSGRNMNGVWLHYTILRIASLLVPSHQRSEWIAEWRSELWYIPQCRATIFCMGAFPDAFWLRRNQILSVKRTGIRLESPLSCLALLAALACVEHRARISHVGPAEPASPDIAGICIGVLTLSCLTSALRTVGVEPPASRYFCVLAEHGAPRNFSAFEDRAGADDCGLRITPSNPPESTRDSGAADPLNAPAQCEDRCRSSSSAGQSPGRTLEDLKE